ncbi:EscU/YscU/HrcU family type III secretion system export apparatus switch protein [Stenotrophomonas sp. B1-1]|uniref:EscU/YscU/HrcU family type III secretion system export apparatus switch protein n=1 Tax=Stenotrophomonas sp. B1-1 TaxID=2710648 RepID=UPI0013D99B68|nr:EscU/YscU/HrcU family type III secretion system export apparatus switch protein [Stenotrophomonas sp. B1-1]
MKSEKATPHKLKKEAQKGKIFQSRDLMALVVLAVGGLALYGLTSLAGVMDLYREMVQGGFQMGTGVALKRSLQVFAMAVMPVAVACIVAVALLSLVLSKGILNAEAIKLDLTRLNPISGFKNLFSMKTVKEFVKAILYVVSTAIFLVWMVKTVPFSVYQALGADPGSAYRFWLSVGFQTGAGFLLALLPVAASAAAADFWLYRKDLRMEKHEVKQEFKETQGNPEVKKRRREIGEELSAQMQADVAGASMVLANPTHIAVGIYLHDFDFPMPFVSLREQGTKARAIIAYAEKIGVPVVRDVRTARAVFHSCKRYQFVSSENIESVMRILCWLRDVEQAAAGDAE